MNGIISFDAYQHEPLRLFSLQHIVPLIIIAVFCLLLYVLRNKLRSIPDKRIIRYPLATLIIVHLVTLYIWYTVAGQWSVRYTLPIQLCDISVFLCVINLLSAKKRTLLLEVLYFWGLGGASQALLTPSMGDYSFPHFIYYQFFFSHGLTIITCLYFTLIEGFRVNLSSVKRVFIITNVYAACIIIVNFITGGNYLFLMSKPFGGSLLDFLGPWPWYILSLEVVAAIVFLILYLPHKDKKTEIRKDIPGHFPK